MTRTSLLFFLIFISQFTFCQEEKIINGKITVKDAKTSEIHVINLTKDKETITNSQGEFTILVSQDDLLVFSAGHLDYMRKIVEQKEYDSGTLKVEMTSKINQLEEVEVKNYSGINAVALGILEKPAKSYTPAERKLYGATSSPLDALINILSGRTKMLENGVEIEKKEFLLEKLDGLYTDQFYLQELGIEKENIKGFHYYLVEDSRFGEALDAKNKTLATFLIIEIAQKYNLINEK
ncbi:hypothetical protein J2X31_000449 [Flavobacterium arsenatis]|uniref:Carboxypeptidase-like regulatory domain-containing protein n=1 Tax=Flavobacterium arsenatis TaxID=1484332 RepID=A0ABU1TKJ1_9FLAO|nr:hypothetical protein [Flavobacterium arsenatis]MDR6966456.1 hypothetical protein [Flavobacterium arsenatis]